MPSTTIADYQVLRDGTFTLDSGLNDVETFTFSVPDDLHSATSGQRKAVLTFNLRPTRDSEVTVRLHTTNIMLVRDFSRSHTRMHQEVFDINQILNTGGGVPAAGAQVLFNVPSGRVIFSDVVIWYQIDR
jgi:hypothetical protein